MGDTLWLPVTPSIRRVARTFLTDDDASASSEWWAPWRSWMVPKCYKCGAFNQYRPPVCLACGDTRTPWRVHALPLHIPAGLAIARVRLAEVNPDDAPAVTDPADVRAYLLEHDPEVTLAADGREKES